MLNLHWKTSWCKYKMCTDMTALLIISLLGVVAMMAEVLHFRRFILPIVTIGLLSALVTVVMDWNTAVSYFNEMALFDNYALAFTGLVICITLLWLIIGGEYFVSGSNRIEHATLILFCLSGAITMISFSDLTMFFIGLEILSISLYILAASDKRNIRSNEAGMKYLLMGAFASGFLLFGIALIYGATASFNLQVIRTALASETIQPAFVHAGVLFILVGLLFKVAAVPFHFWAPDVYEGSPTLVTTFMATVVKTTAFAAFYRLFSTCFVLLADTWVPVVALISAVTMLTGNVMAVYQRSFKRMLAYSSVAHAGYLLMAVVSLNQFSGGAILLYTAAYSLGSLGAFTALHAARMQGEGNLDHFNGLGRRQPLVGIFLSLVMLSMAGIPPVAGFFAKYYIFYGAVESGYLWLVIVAILSSLIGVYYYFRIIYAMFSEDSPAQNAISIDNRHVLLIAIAALLSLTLGISPGLVQGLL